jgi:TonB family protein
VPRFISFALHIAFVLLIVVVPHTSMRDKRNTVLSDHPPILFHLASLPRSDHGGGGNEAPLPVSRGRPPRFSPRAFVPPTFIPDRKAILTVDTALEGPADVVLANNNLTQFGDPFGKDGPFSLGSGRRGIGSEGTGGLGNRPGNGISGDSDGSLGPTTDPQVIFKTEPEFSEEARKAKVQGTVVVEAFIGKDGRIHQAHIRHGLGLGLDEKALEAVAKWLFRPATRRGKPVDVPAVIEINFRLL